MNGVFCFHRSDASIQHHCMVGWFWSWFGFCLLRCPPRTPRGSGHRGDPGRKVDRIAGHSLMRCHHRSSHFGYLVMDSDRTARRTVLGTGLLSSAGSRFTVGTVAAHIHERAAVTVPRRARSCRRVHDLLLAGWVNSGLATWGGRLRVSWEGDLKFEGSHGCDAGLASPGGAPVWPSSTAGSD